MDSSGNFRRFHEELGQDLIKQLGGDDDAKKMAEVVKQSRGKLDDAMQAAGFPTFAIGEPVQIKGRWFTVKGIKKRRLTLKGMPKDWEPGA